jgi:hypothetical protein
MASRAIRKALQNRKKYPSVSAGEWVVPRRKYYRLGCCDCGLVHKMEFKLVDSWHGPGKKILMRAWRDEPATTFLRKAKRK